MGTVPQVCPPGMVNTSITFSDQALFDHHYRDRPFCPIIYVDLKKFRTECNLDLSPWLRQYKPLLYIRTPYSPTIIRLFYFNMRVDDKEYDDDEDVLITG